VQIAREINYNRVLKWKTVEDLDEFYALIKKPPIHSVVVHIEPVVAKHILVFANTNNRPMGKGWAERLALDVKADQYGLTGDTLKFSKEGRMLDGQHRLEACARTSAIITHIVFGLDDEVFDLIDQGSKRTPGHVLKLAGVKDPTIVAGAVRWARIMSERRGGESSWGLSARKVRELAQGPMKDIQRYTRAAEKIREAYHIPPTMSAALLYLISRKSHAIAEDFADCWVNGGRHLIKNKNFDTLTQRMHTVRHHSKGALNRTVLAAMMVQTFNHWHANVAAVPSGITWSKGRAFPELSFDKEAFLHEKNRRDRITDSTLAGVQNAVLKGMLKSQDKEGNIQISTRDLGKVARVPDRQVGYILQTLREAGLIHRSKPYDPKTLSPAIWRIKDAGLKRLESAAV
jgi:hypothetical protein